MNGAIQLLLDQLTASFLIQPNVKDTLQTYDCLSIKKWMPGIGLIGVTERKVQTFAGNFFS